MAKMKQPPAPPQGPTISPDQGIIYLKKDITRGEELLKARPLSDDDLSSWKHMAQQHLKQAFGAEDDTVSQFNRKGSPIAIMNIYDRESEHEREEKRSEQIRAKVAVLKTAIQLLEEQVIPFEFSPGNANESTRNSTPTQGSKVFIVHGHDDAIKHSTARMLEQLGVAPIILHEQANQSRTIIEKLEDHSLEAGFAVVLLTGDDLGRKRAEGGVERLRARQNVILELGYFLGMLGRRRVCALLEDGVEAPSDYDGVTYVPIDKAGAWKFLLGKELRAAGYTISLDNLV